MVKKSLKVPKTGRPKSQGRDFSDEQEQQIIRMFIDTTQNS